MVCSKATLKYQTRAEVPGSNKHVSLLWQGKTWFNLCATPHPSVKVGSKPAQIQAKSESQKHNYYSKKVLQYRVEIHKRFLRTSYHHCLGSGALTQRQSGLFNLAFACKAHTSSRMIARCYKEVFGIHAQGWYSLSFSQTSHYHHLGWSVLLQKQSGLYKLSF